ncbi:Hypothetical protein, predicted transmembrane protein [Mycoplasmopsis agalactiae 14628]|uniref:Uncharacterized protein n=1 Tax=Mycoplasmopsis agalactiae 14628 TaxID=1110504 RepID=I5D511_MYCAA|nr:hypothetical protein [Mycoplasmopsis agalactiae]EIN14770.1 Hypothetical protein, predicted transmembrane protein [Mycoplasmopsis agalactiae 14628]
MQNKSTNKNARWWMLGFGLFVILTTLFYAFSYVIWYDANDEISKTGAPTHFAVFKGWGSFLFYTYLSNFLLGFALIIAGILWANMNAKKALFISVVSITMTFVVYWALLSYQKSTWTSPLNATRSLITHAINPVLGFVALSLIRKELIVTKITFTIPVLISTVYTIFAMILFFATFDKIVPGRGAVVYGFLDFKNPYFYKGNNTGIIVILDFLLYVVSMITPLLFGIMWKFIYKIKYQKSVPKKTKVIAENNN